MAQLNTLSLSNLTGTYRFSNPVILSEAKNLQFFSLRHKIGAPS
jgi:hypothetical protein